MTGPLWFAFILKIKLIKKDNDMGPPDDHLALSSVEKKVYTEMRVVIWQHMPASRLAHIIMNMAT